MGSFVSGKCFLICTSVSSNFCCLPGKSLNWQTVLPILFVSWEFAWAGEGGDEMKFDCNCRLL